MNERIEILADKMLVEPIEFDFEDENDFEDKDSEEGTDFEEDEDSLEEV